MVVDWDVGSGVELVLDGVLCWDVVVGGVSVVSTLNIVDLYIFYRFLEFDPTLVKVATFFVRRCWLESIA